MGIFEFLGKIYAETPKYNVVKKGVKYEIREYLPSIVAEVSYDPSSIRGGRDGGFMILAAYIGAFGSPANSAATATDETGAQSIAMTAPVITTGSEAIAMTVPVVTKESLSDDSEKVLTSMQFILPSKYTMETVPKPTDERVRVREMASRTMAAITFSGVANESLTQKKFAALRNALQEEKAGYKISGEHMLARYNDPFTPWFLRTNEVLVPVDKED